VPNPCSWTEVRETLFHLASGFGNALSGSVSFGFRPASAKRYCHVSIPAASLAFLLSIVSLLAPAKTVKVVRHRVNPGCRCSVMSAPQWGRDRILPSRLTATATTANKSTNKQISGETS
jgi:hypothetical protein